MSYPPHQIKFCTSHLFIFYPLTTNVLKKQVREQPKCYDNATAFLSVPFNSDESHTVRKPLTRAFQICIG